MGRFDFKKLKFIGIGLLVVIICYFSFFSNTFSASSNSQVVYEALPDSMVTHEGISDVIEEVTADSKGSDITNGLTLVEYIDTISASQIRVRLDNEEVTVTLYGVIPANADTLYYTCMVDAITNYLANQKVYLSYSQADISPTNDIIATVFISNQAGVLDNPMEYCLNYKLIAEGYCGYAKSYNANGYEAYTYYDYYEVWCNSVNSPIGFWIYDDFCKMQGIEENMAQYDSIVTNNLLNPPESTQETSEENSKETKDNSKD